MNFCIILLKEQIYRKERIITRMLNKEKKNKEKTIEKRQHPQLATFKAR